MIRHTKQPAAGNLGGEAARLLDELCRQLQRRGMPPLRFVARLIVEMGPFAQRITILCFASNNHGATEAWRYTKMAVDLLCSAGGNILKLILISHILSASIGTGFNHQLSCIQRPWPSHDERASTGSPPPPYRSCTTGLPCGFLAPAQQCVPAPSSRW
ncbi:hypothetical protein NDU88_009250 [Pleurodeles waltl]|uniref:Uncharacterized protein n=1 Tax=Pleurodeles waltl TaxID=8319 RepID=A0AAV7QWV0_PLEWA|nr:hypothetical protein NDU88_009250 [Pleurodeles waltl]